MSYLEDFFDKLTYLPTDVNRYLRLIKDLDRMTEEKTFELERVQSQYLSLIKNCKDRKAEAKKPELKTLLEQIFILQQECQGLAGEKIEAAAQVGEQVEEYLGKLDRDIKNFEVEINISGQNEQKETYIPENNRNDYLNQRKKKKYELKMSKYKQKNRKMAEKNLNSSFTDQIPELLPGVDWDTGLGPIEPIENGELFCYCKKILPDEMIACDNEFCEIEWFHFSCVGLKKKPKENEKWYCRECSQLKKDNLLKF